MLNKKIEQDKENLLDRLLKSEKHFRIAIALILFIISFAIVMIIIGVFSSIRF